MRAPRTPAFSLLEAIMAVTLLAICFLLILPMFDLALRYAARQENEVQAASLARSQLAKVRAWAFQEAGTGYNFDSLNTYPAPTPDPYHPGFRVEVQSVARELYSGCSNFEMAHGATERRVLRSSCHLVAVRVYWDNGGVPGELELSSLLCDPTRRFLAAGAVEVLGTVPPTEILRDDELTFTVKALDSKNQEIKDLFFEWSVSPINGTGTITQTRDGAQATFKNVSRLADGLPHYTGGQCKVKARAVYRGEEQWGESAVIKLKKTP